MMGEGHAELLALIARSRNRWRAVTALRVWMRAAAVAVVALGLALLTHLTMQPAGGALVALWTLRSRWPLPRCSGRWLRCGGHQEMDSSRGSSRSGAPSSKTRSSPLWLMVRPNRS